MELSISFDDAELLAIGELLGERIGWLGPSDLDGLTAAERAERSSAAREALLERGVFVVTDGGQTQVAVVVARLVEILSRPLLTVEVRASGSSGGWDPHASRLAAVPEASVAHERVDGRNRLTPFATTDLLRRAARMAGLEASVPAAARGVTIDQRSLARALDAHSAAQVRGEVEAGIAEGDSDLVDGLVSALMGSRGAIDVRTKPMEGRSFGIQLAWIVGSTGAWEMPSRVTPLDGGADELQGGVLVELVPVSGHRLLEKLASVGKEG